MSALAARPVGSPAGSVSSRAGEGGVTVIMAVGELDFSNASLFREALTIACEDMPARIVVDLSGAMLLDSTALGVLVGGLKRARRGGGTVVLAGLIPGVRKLFAVTGLDKVFAIYESVDDAERGFANGLSTPAAGEAS